MEQIKNLYNQLNYHTFVINMELAQMNIIINKINEIMMSNNNFNKNNNNNVNYDNSNNNIKKDFDIDIYNNIYKELKSKMDIIGEIKNKDQVGDFIFELAEYLYKEEAPKITGMILENDLEILSDIINKPMELKEQIDKGHELIINMS